MKKFLFVLALIFCFSCVAIAENLPRPDKNAVQEEGYCASCKEDKGKAVYSEVTWQPISGLASINGSIRTVFADGSYITTFDTTRNAMIGIALANNLQVIIHWTSPTSWDMIYIGK